MKLINKEKQAVAWMSAEKNRVEACVQWSDGENALMTQSPDKVLNQWQWFVNNRQSINEFIHQFHDRQP